jgi:hypothetical protein
MVSSMWAVFTEGGNFSVRGDSGSWVYGTRHNDLLGMIVMGRTKFPALTYTNPPALYLQRGADFHNAGFHLGSFNPYTFNWNRAPPKNFNWDFPHMNATVHYAEVVEGAGLIGLSVCWLRWAFGLLAALGFRYCICWAFCMLALLVFRCSGFVELSVHSFCSRLPLDISPLPYGIMEWL